MKGRPYGKFTMLFIFNMVIPVQTSYIYISYVVDAYVDFFMKTEFNGVVISHTAA